MRVIDRKDIFWRRGSAGGRICYDEIRWYQRSQFCHDRFRSHAKIT